MKNAHGVEPTRYMKRKESDKAIRCRQDCGPIFGNDIHIGDHCNKEYYCFIENDGTNAYECHPEYKFSLFVNTAGTDKVNPFKVLDYEVFGIDYEDRENIIKLCKYPDIIWRCIETRNISEELLNQFDDDTELLKDLNTIHFEQKELFLKISQYYLRNPSGLLPTTQIVNQQYDSYFKEWIGDCKWKMIYRTSEHDYTAKSFHECCDNANSPTLIVIKSSEGWIFGGYTTKSWSGEGIYSIMWIIIDRKV